MAQQTAVGWLTDQIKEHKKKFGIPPTEKGYMNLIEQAKAMEKEQRIKDYNAGYTDAQCNHINDADNYANEIEYLRSRIDEIDDEIKRREDKIADLLINGETYKKD
jgi:chromosome segregation ATPase